MHTQFLDDTTPVDTGSSSDLSSLIPQEFIKECYQKASPQASVLIHK
jgi:hypothetical protein